MCGLDAAAVMRVMSRSGARNLFLGALSLCLSVGYAANEVVEGVVLVRTPKTLSCPFKHIMACSPLF